MYILCTAKNKKRGKSNNLQFTNRQTKEHEMFVCRTCQLGNRLVSEVNFSKAQILETRLPETREFVNRNFANMMSALGNSAATATGTEMSEKFSKRPQPRPQFQQRSYIRVRRVHTEQHSGHKSAEVKNGDFFLFPSHT